MGDYPNRARKHFVRANVCACQWGALRVAETEAAGGRETTRRRSPVSIPPASLIAPQGCTAEGGGSFIAPSGRLLSADDSSKHLEIGAEQTPDEFIANLVAVFREVCRVLRDDGTLWVNIGDSYAGSGKGRNADGSHQEGGKQGTSRGTVENLLFKTNAPNCKQKDLIGIPWMLAFALRADGWFLRQDIIWHKPNPMPESVTDRCTKAHEYIFLLSKSQKYHFDSKAIQEPAAFDGRKDTVMKGSEKYKNGFVPNQSEQTFHARGHERWQRNDAGEYTRNRRSVWTVSTKPYAGAHFATFPPELIKPCILAGCPPGGVVLDPFTGSGTTLQVAEQNGCKGIGIELNAKYCELIVKRIGQRSLLVA